jgi:hypothetical protein
MTKFSASVSFEGSCTLIIPTHRQYFTTEGAAIETNAADMPPAEFDHTDKLSVVDTASITFSFMRLPFDIRLCIHDQLATMPVFDRF